MGSTVGDNIRARRESLGWTQPQLAREACRAAGLPRDALPKHDIYRYETGRRTPREWLPAIASALGVSIESMRTPARPEHASLEPLPALHQATGEQLAPTIRELNRRLVALDNELHGLPIAESAARAFKTVYRRLGQGVSEAHEREVQSAAAELAEISGWALFNEGRPRESKRFSQEALFLAQMSGDRGIELLTLQNLALLAGWTGRPREELSITRSVLERGGLDPRVEAMFRCREGQGLGRAGDTQRAAQSFARARSLLQEAPPGDSPAWSWWVSEREVDRQQGRILNITDHWRESIPILQRASDESTGTHVGYGLSSYVWLLDSFVSMRAWSDAEEAAHTLIPAVPEVASRVMLDHLERVVSRDISGAPTDLRDAVGHIRSGLEEDPYDF
ncbi:helix-turn-helix transcriptional regulator [Streptomyces diacarni]|uniref:helix-turn-helix transcriptional regulator n=1 Tax=Streptomyces diacarni TaxID=2800381 RepID=UPI001FEB86EF|nr:helix-turn-helix transcriptional regulator [Streptomyces diacarni]